MVAAAGANDEEAPEQEEPDRGEVGHLAGDRDERAGEGGHDRHDPPKDDSDRDNDPHSTRFPCPERAAGGDARLKGGAGLAAEIGWVPWFGHSFILAEEAEWGNPLPGAEGDGGGRGERGGAEASEPGAGKEPCHHRAEHEHGARETRERYRCRDGGNAPRQEDRSGCHGEVETAVGRRRGCAETRVGERWKGGNCRVTETRGERAAGAPDGRCELFVAGAEEGDEVADPRQECSEQWQVGDSGEERACDGKGDVTMGDPERGEWAAERTPADGQSPPTVSHAARQRHLPTPSRPRRG